MSENPDGKPLWLRYVIGYAALAALAVLSVWLVQGLVQAISYIGLLLDLHPFTMTALNQWSFVLLGILWLLGFFWLEHYLRAGVTSGGLGRRVGKTAAWLAGLLLLVYLIQMIPSG